MARRKKTSTKKRASACVVSKPRDVIGVWDNGGKTVDRYTVAFGKRFDANPGYVQMLGMSGSPTHPQGFSQWGEGKVGRHLGKRLPWRRLPPKIRAHVCARMKD